jgi:hypothetical protein
VCNFLFCISFLPAASTVVEADSWKPHYLDRLPLSLQSSGTTEVGATLVRWEAWDQDALLVFPISPEALVCLLGESYEAAGRVARSLGIETSGCDSEKKLYVLHLDGATINDEDRFGDWRTINGGHLQVIHGIYDPTPDVPHDAVLLYSEPDSPRSRVLVHELGHYWYDRLCMSRNSKVKTETFARAVEDAWLIPL